MRRDARAVEWDGLENRCPFNADRGFESLSLRRTYYTKWTVSRQKPTNQRLVAGNQLRVYLQSLLTSTLQELRPALPPP